MRHILPALLFSVTALSLQAQPAVQHLGTVTGRVFCSDSQTPCRFASVSIESAPPADALDSWPKSGHSHSYAGMTDMDGTFQINEVAEGEYYILGQLAGYLSPYDMAVGMAPGGTALSAKAIDVALSRITVAAGRATATNLVLRRGASLAGTIRYDDGGMGINLPVSLFRKDLTGAWVPYKNRAGDSSLAPLGFGSHTDDRGHFYEPGLPSGTYTVEVTLPITELAPQGILGPSSLQTKITTGNALEVFSGNRYRLKEAVPVTLNEGEENSDVDITIPITGLCLLHGSVTAKLDGRVIGRGRVRLLDPSDKTVLRESDIREDGSFEFRYVVAGAYLIEVSGSAGDKDAVHFQPMTTQLLVQSDMPDLNYALASSAK